jgi:hypothetical protein
MTSIFFQILILFGIAYLFYTPAKSPDFVPPFDDL